MKNVKQLLPSIFFLLVFSYLLGCGAKKKLTHHQQEGEISNEISNEISGETLSTRASESADAHLPPISPASLGPNFVPATFVQTATPTLCLLGIASVVPPSIPVGLTGTAITGANSNEVTFVVVFNKEILYPAVINSPGFRPTETIQMSPSTFYVSGVFLASGNVNLNIGFQVASTAAQKVCSSTAFVSGNLVKPEVTLKASLTSLSWNGSTKLSWTSTNATACTLSSNLGLSVSKPLSSTDFLVSGLKQNVTYTVACSNASGTTRKSVTIAVAPVIFKIPNITLAGRDVDACIVDGGCASGVLDAVGWQFCKIKGYTQSENALWGEGASGTTKFKNKSSLLTEPCDGCSYRLTQVHCR